MKLIFITLIFLAMQSKAQEIQNIFGKEIQSLNVYNAGREQENKFPLVFFDKTVKDSKIGILGNKISSIAFSINGKENLNLLEKIIKTYENPKMGIESSLFPNSNDETGAFGYGKVSSKDFVFDKVKLGEYIYLIWDTEFLTLHYYKPKTIMNDSEDIKVEIVAKD